MMLCDVVSSYDIELRYSPETCQNESNAQDIEILILI